MKYLIVFFYVNIAFAQTPWNDGSWQIWQKDSFMVAAGASGSLFHTVTGKHGKYNSDPAQNTLEPQLYTNSSNNVFVNSGNVHLRLLQEDNTYNVDGVNRDFHYTSGMIQTYASYRFGYFEVRCICPPGKGFWYGLWLQTGAESICNYEELDIFENQGDMPRYTSNNIAYQSVSASCNTADNPTLWQPQLFYNLPYDNTSGYHVWGCEWSPNVIIFYLDNVELGRRYINSDMTIYQNAMPVILNLALNSPQNHVDATRLFSLVDNTTPIPSDFVIDYLRIYRLKRNVCNTADETLITSTDFTNYTPEIKHNITVGNGTTSVTASTIVLRASNEITINANFSVPLGTEFTAMVTPCNW